MHCLYIVPGPCLKAPASYMLGASSIAPTDFPRRKKTERREWRDRKKTDRPTDRPTDRDRRVHGRNNECSSDVDARLSKNPSHGTFEELRRGRMEGSHHLSEKVCPMQCHASHRTLPALVLQRSSTRTTKKGQCTKFRTDCIAFIAAAAAAAAAELN